MILFELIIIGFLSYYADGSANSRSEYLFGHCSQNETEGGIQ